MARRVVALLLPCLMVALAHPAARGQDENPVVKLVKSKVADPAKPFALLVTFKVKAGKEADFEAAFRPCLPATRKEPGCVAYELNRDPDHPELYVMYEKFRGVPALEEHLRQKHTVTLLAAVVPMCDGGPQVKVFTAPGE